MSSLGSPNPLLFGGAAKGYEIERSVRFDKTITDQAFDWTPSSDGNRKTWTFSCWLKRTKLAPGSTFLSARLNNLMIYIRFLYDQFDMLRWNGSSAAWQLRTNREFRDTGSWYHIVVAFDTTQGTASNRIKLYVNGSQETSFDIANYPNQNTDWHVNQSGYEQSIGVNAFDGYITEVNFIDGQALDASNFGETDSDTGQWIPKEFEGTYGSNGYFLNFADNSAATAAAIGKDSSGNGNNFTPDNVSVATTFAGDSFPDTPTNNMCVMNAVYNGNGNDSVIEKGGLHVDTASSSTDCLANIGIPQTGKWFFEAKMTELNSEGSSTGWIGIASSRPTSTAQPRVAYYGYTGDKWIDDTGTTYGAAYTANDVIGVAVNMDDSEITFYKNGTSQGAITSWRVTGNQYFFMVGDGGSAGSTEYELNFGQKAFLHSKPAGYKILTTNNLPEPTIKKGTDHFATTLYTGNATDNRSIPVGFAADLTILKQRDYTKNWYWYDTIRGANKQLLSNGINAEAEIADRMQAFESNSIQIGTSSEINNNNSTYINYSWKAGSSVSNSDGSVTSTVRANPSAGFSIVQYDVPSGAGNFTVGHGLGVAPELILAKNIDTDSNWEAFSSSIPNTDRLKLNSNAAKEDQPSWGDTSPTSSVFTSLGGGAWHAVGKTMINYCFCSIEGYSKFGSYIGNGSADGTFVYTGFRVSFLMCKKTSGTGNWAINDIERDISNTEYGNDVSLYANSNAQETTSSSLNVDFLSNGFKLRSDNSSYNGDGGTYIYMAFAERPFKHANAR